MITRFTLLAVFVLIIGCDRSEKITLTIHNPDGTISEIETTVSALEKEEEIKNDKYHHVNIIIHADGTIQKQGGETISDAEFIELLDKNTEKEKMVTFVSDFGVSKKRFLELNDIVRQNGVNELRIINEEMFVEPIVRGNEG